MKVPQKIKWNYCAPIRVEDGDECAVEFAREPSQPMFTRWRIRYDDGRVKTGYCGDEGHGVFYLTRDQEFEHAERDVWKAVQRAWPVWEAMRDHVEAAPWDSDTGDA